MTAREAKTKSGPTKTWCASACREQRNTVLVLWRTTNATQQEQQTNRTFFHSPKFFQSEKTSSVAESVQKWDSASTNWVWLSLLRCCTQRAALTG